MKFFAIFSAIVAVALASPATWTIHELSEAIQSPSTDAALIPYLEQALNELMIQAISGNPQPATTVSSPVQDFSSWSLNELSEAIQDPATNAALIPYLEHALNTMMANIMSGQQQETIIVATPVGLLPVEVVVPVVPAPVETPVIPAEPIVVPEASPASPLVQIIVNIKSQEVAAPAPVAVPEVNPVVPAPVVLPEPVFPVVVPNPIDIIAINPETVVPEPVIVAPVIVPNPIDIIAINPETVVPEPVIVAPVIVPNPVDIIAVNPEVIVNPVDVIAIAAPEVNPVDILSPVPVVAPVGAIDGVVGPIV